MEAYRLVTKSKLNLNRPIKENKKATCARAQNETCTTGKNFLPQPVGKDTLSCGKKRPGLTIGTEPKDKDLSLVQQIVSYEKWASQ